MHGTRIGTALAAVMLAASVGGCATWDRMSAADKGTAIGAGVGGVAGAAATEGGVLGTVGGAAVGGVVGREVGKRQQKR
ncbi:MAG TPA: glycine zipper 2TM domain-containing protein [Rhodocyclaceae bacterium]|nr:glycine zipper 2TM domain-containing protein [Rhodocyclaceae bacterium]